jgi:GH18 family chitinase
MVQSAANRAAFVSGCISFAHDNHFDGIDIDWEGHPDTENSTETVTLFADLRAAINADGKSFGSNLLLTAALQPGKQYGGKWIAQSVNQYSEFCWKFH